MCAAESDARAALAALQQRLGEVLTSADPAAKQLELLPDASLDGDGVRVASLLIANLRFQRLVAASREALQWFHDEPESFVAAFKRYHAEVPVGALDVWSEADAFTAWCAGPADRPTDQ